MAHANGQPADSEYCVVFEFEEGTGNLGLQGGMRNWRSWPTEEAYRAWQETNQPEYAHLRPIHEGVTPEEAQACCAEVGLATRIAAEVDIAYDPTTDTVDRRLLGRRITSAAAVCGPISPAVEAAVIGSVSLALMRMPSKPDSQ